MNYFENDKCLFFAVALSLERLVIDAVCIKIGRLKNIKVYS